MEDNEYSYSDEEDQLSDAEVNDRNLEYTLDNLSLLDLSDANVSEATRTSFDTELSALKDLNKKMTIESAIFSEWIDKYKVYSTKVQYLTSLINLYANLTSKSFDQDLKAFNEQVKVLNTITDINTYIQYLDNRYMNNYIQKLYKSNTAQHGILSRIQLQIIHNLLKLNNLSTKQQTDLHELLASAETVRAKYKLPKVELVPSLIAHRERNIRKITTDAHLKEKRTRRSRQKTTEFLKAKLPKFRTKLVNRRLLEERDWLFTSSNGKLYPLWELYNIPEARILLPEQDIFRLNIVFKRHNSGLFKLNDNPIINIIDFPQDLYKSLIIQPEFDNDNILKYTVQVDRSTLGYILHQMEIYTERRLVLAIHYHYNVFYAPVDLSNMAPDDNISISPTIAEYLRFPHNPIAGTDGHIVKSVMPINFPRALIRLVILPVIDSSKVNLFHKLIPDEELEITPEDLAVNLQLYSVLYQGQKVFQDLIVIKELWPIGAVNPPTVGSELEVSYDFV